MSIADDGTDQDEPSRAPVIGRLKRRAEFLHVGKGYRWHGKAMTLQAQVRRGVDAAETSPRVGFTLTKRVGNAVVRNRARRRLREAVRLAGDHLTLKSDFDYVVVGRIEALRIPFAALGRELAAGADAVEARDRKRARGVDAGGGDESTFARRDGRGRNATPPGRQAPERTRSTP